MALLSSSPKDSSNTYSTDNAAIPSPDKYLLKFGINVPYADIKRLVQSGSRLLYSLKDCSRAGRVCWKLKLHRSRPGTDATVAAHLKFEPQTFTEAVHCAAEFVVRVSGDGGRGSGGGGRGFERRSAGVRVFSRERDTWGWSEFARASELGELVSGSADGVEEHLKLSGAIRIQDASRLLYPGRRHNFARSGDASDFRIRVALATFHVHRAVLTLNSDHFALLLARSDCLEARSGQAVLSDDRIQDVHLMLQFMYPGYPDVLDDSTLPALSRLAAKYQVHTLAWHCVQFVDSKLAPGDSQTPPMEADRALMYYTVSLKALHCPELAEQCARAAARLPWRQIKEATHFRELAEPERAVFLQAYLDFREAACAGAVKSGVADVSQVSSDTGIPADAEADSSSPRDISD